MLHAKIIPLTRLPRPLGLFDYLAPKEIAKDIQVGQLVTIPWRKSELFGLVFVLTEFGEKKTAGLKAVSGIAHEEPLVSKSHLDFLQILSQWYGVSLATLAQMSLLPLQKKKLSLLKLSPITHHKPQKLRLQTTPARQSLTLQASAGGDFRLQIYHSQQSHASALSATIRGPTLLLVPEIYLIDEIHRLLPLALQGQTVIWHSQLTTKQQFERWLQIRSGERTIVLGTRGAVFLPIPNLQTIIIDYEHAENHKHWDQAPRFHVKDVAPLLAAATGATIHPMSYSPSVEGYDHDNTMSSPRRTSGESTTAIKISPDIRLIDLRAERRAGRFGLIADEIKETMRETVGDIFIFINRLGFSTSVGCNGCGYVARCERCQLPLIYHQKTSRLHCHYCQIQIKPNYVCPRCQNRVVQLRGAGTEFVETGVKKLFGDRLDHEIMRIDSERDPSTVAQDKIFQKPRIVVGTRMAFRHVRWEKTDLIVYVGIDQQLSLPEYRATEAVWHTVQETLYRKTAASRLYIQTFNPDNLLFQSLRAPEGFYERELKSRRALGYPPYQYLARYFYGQREARLAEREAERVYALLKSHLTKEKKSARISRAIEMQPRFYRNQFWYVIIVKLNPENWPDELFWLNQFIPANWKIDPNPISLLSP